LFYRGTKVYDIDVGEQFEKSLARKITDDLEKMNVSSANFGLDISGDGGKVLSAFNVEMQERGMDGQFIVPISSMGNASESIVSAFDPRPANEVYDRRVTEYWFQVYHAFASRRIYGMDTNRDRDVVSELCSRQYSFKGKKISVETKKDMKKRMGKSPDLADSFCYLFFMAYRLGVHFIATSESDISLSSDYKTDDHIDYGSYSGNGTDPDGF
jgi:hypothetical protein